MLALCGLVFSSRPPDKNGVTRRQHGALLLLKRLNAGRNRTHLQVAEVVDHSRGLLRNREERLPELHGGRLHRGMSLRRTSNSRVSAVGSECQRQSQDQGHRL